MRHDSDAPDPGLGKAAAALLTLQAALEQREARLTAAIGRELESLQSQVKQVRRDVAGVVDAAGARIANEAQAAALPVVHRLDQALAAASNHVHSANRAVWVWLGAAGTVLLVALLVAWAVLGYYRRELAAAKDELARYDSAIPVVRAFYASDAQLCGGRICVNIEPGGQRVGDKRQYRQAKARPQ
ncbi:hypothetical protein [Variovorax sp.]|uniref:hypothetical protein n=1 Tax=Variovorax sp. TaxID=1871043 RepID=UPI002D70A255|nr:hypothetical protein [Variovorax sp.]HYP83743.1 hypothetical protein [Variovorax sp.]